MSETVREQIDRERLRIRLIDEMHKDTARFRRAQRFCHEVQALLRDFLPRDRDCCRRIDEYLLLIAFENNLETISVPPECDEFDKLALQRKRLETAIVRAGGDIEMPGQLSDCQRPGGER